jgi:hypothetical protein
MGGALSVEESHEDKVVQEKAGNGAGGVQTKTKQFVQRVDKVEGEARGKVF